LQPHGILITGSILLTCGCLGLIIVRLNGPRLHGLGWLGASFASGALGASLFVLYRYVPPVLNILFADLFILLAFVLIHLSFLTLLDLDSRLPRASLLLLALQALDDLPSIYSDHGGPLRIFTVGVLVAAQTALTVRLLVRSDKRGIRAPAWFCIGILSLFSAANLARSLACVTGLLNDLSLAIQVQALTFMLYIAVALGVAFGFFWMVTSKLCFSLEEMAGTDPLTRIYNRRVFREWCMKEMSRSNQLGSPFSVMMIDIDHFKQINDRFGHHNGDAVICLAVEQMQNSIRGIDVLGRWGGEEFVALLPGASIAGALTIAQRLRGNIEKLSLSNLLSHTSAGSEPPRLTVSLGIATYRGPSDHIDHMLVRADDALYRAKQTGRNRVSTEQEDTPRTALLGNDKLNA
jgi:diguanylate cyclase (GGDEF)-like protein